MKTRFALILALLVSAVRLSAATTPLFDGKTFAGWEGDIGSVWRIEDGALVAGSQEKRQEKNNFLATTRRYADFELTLHWKLEGAERSANAGVQFRSKRVPGSHEVSGYQADIAVRYDGSLYDESRRKKMLATPPPEVLAKAQKPLGQWNETRIRAEGPRIRIWLNGVQTVDYTETEAGIDTSGIIALQIHGGAPSIVRYKDIAIEELRPAVTRQTEFKLRPGDTVVLVGGANLERTRFNAFLQTHLLAAPEAPSLRVRNLAWEGDTVFEQWRDVNFPGIAQQLAQVGATVVLVQFGQMEASNLSSPGGYSNDNVTQWPEIKARLARMDADKALQDGVSRAISPLKRLTKDTEKPLTFPATYIYDKSVQGHPVAPRTLFGDEAPVIDGDRRRAFAEWITSPRNPRFAKNAANRLWKRVMGAGLIEPVDSLTALPHPEHRELLEFLTSALIGFRFDERAFLAVLLNTRLYQSEAVRERPEPGSAFGLHGPLLRRLSAEQIWDSHLVLLVPDLDERKSAVRHEGSLLNPARLRRLTTMNADEIIARSRDEMAYRVRRREHTLRLAEQKKELAAAQARGNAAEVRRVQAGHARENETFYSPELQALEMGDAQPAPETDPRWQSLPRNFLRASEIPLPLPLGHFLRQFGQSDRREIDAFNRDPNTTHALALMNGELAARVLAPDSLLRRQLASADGHRDRMTALIYRALLVRSPSDGERSTIASLTATSLTPVEDTIWALLNSPEFLFQR